MGQKLSYSFILSYRVTLTQSIYLFTLLLVQDIFVLLFPHEVIYSIKQYNAGLL